MYANTTQTDDQQQTEQQQQQPTPHTLAEILAARTRKLDRDKREAAEQAQRELEGRRQDAITAFTTRYEQMFPQSLRDALAATIGYDATHERDEDGDETERGPFATYEHDGEPWMIRREYYYGDRYWTLEGPNNYAVKLAQDWDWQTPSAPFLDALNAYPQWLADKQQRERQKAEQAATKAATAETEAEADSDEPTIYAYVAGDSAEHYGFLNTGARVWLRVETPETGEYGGKHDTIRAQVIDWDAQWLLINEDDRETQQRLIPVARVVSIQPRA